MQKFVLTTIAIHNYLRLADHAVYTPVGFVNSQASSGEIRPGEWRRIVDDVGMSSIPNVCGSRYANTAIAMREVVKNYVNGETGNMECQWDHVRRS